MPIDDYLEKLEIKPEDVKAEQKDEDLDLDLDSILGKLKYQETKDELIRTAVKKGITTKKEHIQIAIKNYLELGNFKYAAELAEKIGLTAKAIDLYAKAKNYNKAAELAKNHKKYNQAVKLYEKGTNYYEAGKLSEEIGDFKKAYHFYQFGKCKEDIKRIEQTRHYKLFTMDTLEKTGCFKAALQIAEELGNDDKVKLYKSIIKLFFKENSEGEKCP